MKKQRKKGQWKSSGAPVMPGFDYGIDRLAAMVTSPVFDREMRKADIIACAYGQMSAPGFGSVVPCISMVARNPGPLKEAFQQLHAWIEATGPDALKSRFCIRVKATTSPSGPNTNMPRGALSASINSPRRPFLA
jgi:hypothetical protein